MMPYISEIRTSTPEDMKNPTGKKAFKMLDQLKIPYECVSNDAVSTMEECRAIEEVLGTEIRKNIFLCNKKNTSFFLIVLPADKNLDVDTLSAKIGIPKLSFASADSMQQHLGAQPGSASVMGLINDEDEYVQLIIDKEVAEAEWYGCNPGINTAHLRLKTSDLLNKFLPKIYHKAKIVEL
jgi:Ala-tRNA(Pro) deacylase